ncbi:aminodeoxychorismate lyase [Geobacillus stearothermophilus]|uniref:Aminodeoxychorismate lyase n=1 Tax=Geobacillus stearothermophilus TaxID=1422 RepID=A0A150N3G9_GEOSE|nr:MULTISPECIES: aminodeoxychorismate lyase [Geobacillus]ASS87488.1 4-amino-4-deoxychorismate lyase [Geobacillus lituanicus]MED0652563.1 aminodeoxychorismate lyase [Anoxybacillus geothermalis]KQC46638.1 4-amino-4-deoxychorismate lyase [Geobacillus sp. Sah69]KYD31297.1 Aminodeoxychorismate lyase [Geobacillus stearothermophilus]KZM54282.1 4-amino-4-deoxychorismate lyase [Geobacillus stearothermophilus]
MYVYVNGEIVPYEEARVSAFDHGFLYGIGLFETFRTYEGHPFLLDDHLARLNRGLSELRIQKQVSRAEALGIIERLLRANGLQDAYVRFNVSAGVGGLGLSMEQYSHPTVIVYMKPLPPSAPPEGKEGVVLTTRRNSPEGDERLKSHHYLNNIIGKWELGRRVDVEGIFLNRDGQVAEGIVSNIFWVKDGVVYTPAPSVGILNGVTRQFVIALLERLHIPIKEGAYPLSHLQEADEVFITNSLQEIVPLHRIGRRSYSGKHGPVTCALQHHYRRFTDTLWTRNELKERMNE